ncbi:heat stress transcription factor B-4-like protein [Tanacetum coccineum]
MSQLSFEQTELDGEAGIADVAGSGVESFGLSHDESFGDDDLDVNLNEPEPVVAEVITQEPILEEVGTQEPTMEDVVLEDYVIFGEDVEQGNGQEDESAPSDGQFFYDEGIDTAYEIKYDVQSIEDASTDADDDDDEDEDFLVDEDNEIVEPDVDVYLFGISMDLPFDNIGVTNLVPDDVLEREDVDVINADGFDSDPGNDDDLSNYKRRSKKFTTAKEAKDIVYLHSIESKRNLKVYKNDSVKIRARCDEKVPVYTLSQDNEPTGPNRRMEVGPSGSGVPSTRINKRKNIGTNNDSQACSSVLDAHDKGDMYPWVLYVGKDKHTKNWVVKTHKDTHKCLQSREIKHCTYKFFSEKIFNKVRVNPEIPVKAVQEQFQRNLEVQISMSKAFRAKAKAKREIRGDHVLQYSMLKDNVVELQATNPNTTVKIVVERNTDHSMPTRVFQRIYICLGALKLGFRSCRRDLLGLDGAFMKGPFLGQVLVVVGIDSNNRIYPLAYTLVEAESKISWCWFLQCLGDDTDLHPNSNFTFISDRQKRIIPAIKIVFPSEEHIYCLRYIHENIQQGWCGQACKDLLWRSTSATSVKDFEKYMFEFKKMNPKCMTRSSTNELFTPYKEPEREFQSSRRHFKTLSLDELRSPDFNLLSDQEYSEEEEAEAMAETMEQYMSKTRTDYGSGVARPKIDNKDQFELKAQFLKELRENTFSGSDNEDANEHIEKVLKIVDLFHVPNITVDQLML